MTLQLHGLIEDMSNEEYHAADGLSKSNLDKLAISGLAYWDAYINPDREPQEYKHCFAVGDGTHKIVLEPGTFESSYAVGFDKTAYPDALDTAAELKKELSSRNLMISGAKPELVDRLIEGGYPREKIILCLESDHNKTMGNRIPIPARDYKNMMGMLTAIERHHTAGGLIKNAHVEQSFFVVDEYGILRKCRSDLITTSGQIMGDLKTTDDVSASGFGRTIVQRRYEVQAAWYLDVLDMLYGKDAPQIFCFIAAQKLRPHDVAVHFLNDDQIARGRALYQRDLENFLRWRDTNQWLGSDEGKVIEAVFPRWAESEFNNSFN